MTGFLITVGILGLVALTMSTIVRYFDNDPLLHVLLAWGFFFFIAMYGFYKYDAKPVKVETAQTLAVKQYQQCIGQYDSGVVLKTMKLTEEQLCANLNAIYKKKVLDVK